MGSSLLRNWILIKFAHLAYTRLAIPHAKRGRTNARTLPSLHETAHTRASLSRLHGECCPQKCVSFSIPPPFCWASPTKGRGFLRWKITLIIWGTSRHIDIDDGSMFQLSFVVPYIGCFFFAVNSQNRGRFSKKRRTFLEKRWRFFELSPTFFVFCGRKYLAWWERFFARWEQSFWWVTMNFGWNRII